MAKEVKYAWIVRASAGKAIPSSALKEIEAQLGRVVYDLAAKHGVMPELEEIDQYKSMELVPLKVQGEVNAAR